MTDKDVEPDPTPKTQSEADELRQGAEKVPGEGSGPTEAGSTGSRVSSDTPGGDTDVATDTGTTDVGGAPAGTTDGSATGTTGTQGGGETSVPQQ